MMSLRDDAKKVIEEILGPEAANIINTFDNPEKYPKDFLDECVYFLEKLVGEESAKKRFEPLYEKYVK